MPKVAWAALMYKLELATLISNMSSNADYDEVNLRIELGHVFSAFKPGVAPRHESRGIE